jgi:hypothetical protein
MPIRIQTIDASSNDHGQLARARSNHRNAILTNCTLDVVIEALRRAGEDLIEQIDIIGHGHPGQLNVGGGVSPEAHQVIAIDENGRLFNRNILSMLCGHFTSNAVVRLHACRVAQGWRGELLLFNLADLWRIRVQGGLVTQFPDRRDHFEGTHFVEANGAPNNLEPLATLRIAR